MADKEHIETDKKIKAMEKHLSAIYRQADKEVQKEANEFLERFKKQDEEKRLSVQKGTLDKKEYEKWRKEKMLYSRRFAELKEHISNELLNANTTAIAYINGELPNVYAMNYNALIHTDVGKIKDYSFSLIDADTVRNLADEKKTFLPYKYVNEKKDIRWNNKKVNNAMLQGIIQGDSVNEIAKRLEKVCYSNEVAARRDARTMVTSAENKGRQDSYERAEKDGVVLVKEWISALDESTRLWHAELNGVQVGIDESWDTGEYGTIEYPGDPSADPANTYNCRCTMVTRVIGFKRVSE